MMIATEMLHILSSRLKNADRMLKNGKVGRVTGIIEKILKSGFGSRMKCLCKLFNICAKSIPDNWKNAVFCPLYIKKEKKTGGKKRGCFVTCT